MEEKELNIKCNKLALKIFGDSVPYPTIGVWIKEFAKEIMNKTQSLEVAMQTAEAINKLLKLAKREHYYCQDCWYTCPQHPEGTCNDTKGDECDCGADRINKEIEEIELLLKQDSRLSC